MVAFASSALAKKIQQALANLPPNYKVNDPMPGPAIFGVPKSLAIDSDGMITVEYGMIESTRAAAAKQCKDFWRGCVETMEREYLHRFGRLPGSNRTSRLRKKRRTIVFGWYLEHHRG